MWLLVHFQPHGCVEIFRSRVFQSRVIKPTFLLSVSHLRNKGLCSETNKVLAPSNGKAAKSDILCEVDGLCRHLFDALCMMAASCLSVRKHDENVDARCGVNWSYISACIIDTDLIDSYQLRQLLGEDNQSHRVFSQETDLICIREHMEVLLLIIILTLLPLG